MTGAVALMLAAAPLPSSAAWRPQQAASGAMQQSNKASDIKTTAEIRRALINNKSLSVRAHNVTIITQDGKVTLKGAVTSADEKQTVESAAARVAGTGNVDDQLTIHQ
jgi:hyperosmotically inducible periplasmic protein